jgi:hypothetical protein
MRIKIRGSADRGVNDGPQLLICGARKLHTFSPDLTKRLMMATIVAASIATRLAISDGDKGDCARRY